MIVFMASEFASLPNNGFGARKASNEFIEYLSLMEEKKFHVIKEPGLNNLSKTDIKDKIQEIVEQWPKNGSIVCDLPAPLAAIVYSVRTELRKVNPIIRVLHQGPLVPSAYIDLLLSVPFMTSEDSFVIGSHNLADCIRSLFPSIKVSFCPTFGINRAKLNYLANQMSENELRTNLQLGKEKYFVMVSMEGRLYGIKSALEMFSRFKEYALVIVGVLEKLVRFSFKEKIDKLSDRLFLIGRIPQNLLVPLLKYSQGHQFLSTMAFDTMGLANLETLAVGRPVLCTAWNGFGYIQNNYNGFKVGVNAIDLSVSCANPTLGINKEDLVSKFCQFRHLAQKPETTKNCINTTNRYHMNKAVAKIKQLERKVVVHPVSDSCFSSFLSDISCFQNLKLQGIKIPPIKLKKAIEDLADSLGANPSIMEYGKRIEMERLVPTKKILPFYILNASN
jgi:glycosyltransferase involved in cell wall biosynthesis